jgi:hypothetical protein
MLLARLFARLVGLVWLLALAALGLGIAMYCLDGLVGLGSARPDRLLDLPDVRDHVGRFLAQMGAHGPVAALSLLCGVGALAAGLLLICGLVGPGERRLRLRHDRTTGTLSARRRTLRSMLHALANEPHEAHVAKRPTLSHGPHHRHGPRVTVRGQYFLAAGGADQAKQAIERELQPLTGPFGLIVRIRMAADQPRRRVR